jgi:hypothetical protein
MKHAATHVAESDDVIGSKRCRCCLTVQPADAVICLGCGANLEAEPVRPPAGNRVSEADVAGPFHVGEAFGRAGMGATLVGMAAALAFLLIRKTIRRVRRVTFSGRHARQTGS